MDSGLSSVVGNTYVPAVASSGSDCELETRASFVNTRCLRHWPLGSHKTRFIPNGQYGKTEYNMLVENGRSSSGRSWGVVDTLRGSPTQEGKDIATSMPGNPSSSVSERAARHTESDRTGPVVYDDSSARRRLQGCWYVAPVPAYKCRIHDQTALDGRFSIRLRSPRTHQSPCHRLAMV